MPCSPAWMPVSMLIGIHAEEHGTRSTLPAGLEDSPRGLGDQETVVPGTISISRPLLCDDRQAGDALEVGGVVRDQRAIQGQGGGGDPGIGSARGQAGSVGAIDGFGPLFTERQVDQDDVKALQVAVQLGNLRRPPVAGQSPVAQRRSSATVMKEM